MKEVMVVATIRSLKWRRGVLEGMKTSDTCFFLSIGCLVCCNNDLGKRGWHHLWIASVMVFLEYIVVIPRALVVLDKNLLKVLFCKVGLL
jgi:hypothetical protein